MINKFTSKEKAIISREIFAIRYYFEDNFSKTLDFYEWKSGEEIKDKKALCNKMLLAARLSLFQLLREKELLSTEKLQEIKKLIYSCENDDSAFFTWQREEFTEEEKKKLPKTTLDSIPM